MTSVHSCKNNIRELFNLSELPLDKLCYCKPIFYVIITYHTFLNAGKSYGYHAAALVSNFTSDLAITNQPVTRDHYNFIWNIMIRASY